MLYYMGLSFFAVLAVIFYIKNRKSGEVPVKKLDVVNIVTNVILSVLYIPFSMFSILMTMVSEGIMAATNQQYIDLVYIFCSMMLTIPFLCITGIVLSVVFRKKGHSIWAFLIQFLPLAVFGIAGLILMYSNTLPRT